MLHFTRQEREVILFLVSVALAGMGINFFAKTNSQFKSAVTVSLNMGKVDINSADQEMLMNVSGIGQKLAQRIIEYRNDHGVFKELPELKNIKGINEYRYGKIKEFLILE
jgi:competence ComEA-like helix-hairpin-helix protein